MRIENPSREQLAKCFAALDRRAAMAGKPEVKYLDLGTHVVKLVNHSREFTPHIERQLTWALKDSAPRHDATLVVWRENDVAAASLSMYGQFHPEEYRKLRIKRLTNPNRVTIPELLVWDDNVSRHHPLISMNMKSKVIVAGNYEPNTYYYGVNNLQAEEFIRHGHIFVKTFSKILKSPSSSLVHGAAIGLNNKGVLLCALGYRGKTTLSVSALLDGFDYVSDDYLVLGMDKNELRAWPIYSIIALAPEMYGKMYDRLKAKFVSNNGRRDKYIFNISEYHSNFVSGYPISLCMYPRKTLCNEPSIVPGDRQIAIEEFVFSTVNQMDNSQNVEEIAKLHSFVKDLPFYRINLSPNIDKNIRCLRDFLENLK